MIRIRKQRILASMALTAVLIGNGVFLADAVPTSGAQIAEAGLPIPSWHWMHKDYDDKGNLIGCSGSGDNCLAICIGPLVLTVSNEGVTADAD